MTVDTRGRDAARWARGAVAMIEVPEAGTVVARRHRQHRTRTALAGAAVILVLGAGVATAVAVRRGGDTGRTAPIAVNPKHAPALLSFRAVQQQLPADRCAGWQGFAGERVLPSIDKKTCYVVGPDIMTAKVVKADPVVSPSTASVVVDVTFANDDFRDKIAKNYVGRSVAMVVGDVVYSAPTVEPDITGREVQISGNFSTAQVQRLVAALRGVDPQDVVVPGQP